MKTDKTYEVCPHCGEEVELDAELKVQVCPNCGKHIVTCSMCTQCDDNTISLPCEKCPLCYLAEQMNVQFPQVEENKEPKTKVFRFHAHTWNDVVVDESELNLNGDEDEETIDDMLYDKALDKYNNGDYDSSDVDNFENTDVEEITDYLKYNKFYPFNE